MRGRYGEGPFLRVFPIIMLVNQRICISIPQLLANIILITRKSLYTTIL